MRTQRARGRATDVSSRWAAVRRYRNFFYPDARWQFSGVRLARDA